MLRIISVLFLLIISQITFASISSSTETIAATPPSGTKTVWRYLGHDYEFNDFQSFCVAKGFANSSLNFINWDGNLYCNNSFAAYPTTTSDTAYTCPAGYALSGTNCTKESSVDSCTSYAGQSGYFWVNKVNPPSTICSGTCLASAVTVAGFPDADPLSWQYLQYTYTGATSGCSADSGFTDEATAAAANAAAAERERLAKIQKAIDDAIASCGGTGHYTTGTFNGNTVITCKDTGVQNSVNNSTTTATTNNSDGSTTTTTFTAAQAA